ncbi:Trp biosynthesis-associated membrane protein [Microbacterium stercoris]|uniref:Trp biosynthesis-associated membrane protein n=1 Tax=Microbacterium stercoris TaxID=2820289 RepID=A0A939QT83_9MICO|nr:Trp biosynthesis-associated membrane protein [Microbacterium stercoris]MBO3664241.1 Trp biosynthesis-associated membrane protein [Microbacterium stercoris]
MSARLRSLTVVALIAAGALGLIGSTQTWIIARLADGDLPVPGSTAVPVLQPLMLTALALGLVLTLVGRVLRYVLGVIAIALGIGVGVLTAPILYGIPASAVAPAVTEHTGITGEAVSALVESATATPWPVVTLIAALVIVGAGVVVLLTAHRWTRAGRRYATAPAAPRDEAAPLDAVDSWDDLSRGDDPTDPGAGAR